MANKTKSGQNNKKTIIICEMVHIKRGYLIPYALFPIQSQRAVLLQKLEGQDMLVETICALDSNIGMQLLHLI